MPFHLRHRIATRLIAGLTVLTLGGLPVGCLLSQPAGAQTETSITVEFKTVLEPYGRWTSHQRWGEVWKPEHVAADWRPYKVGHWSWTEEWGWYWVSDEDFGWVTFHYGRWVFDADLGWIWIPAAEWGAAWVEWRRGTRHVGWAPLPPREDLEVELRERVEYWVFVRVTDFVAERIDRVVVPPEEARVVIRETVVENRTIVAENTRIGVDPGIPPEYIAAAVGRPIRAVEIRPPVIAGTASVSNAIVVERGRRERVREEVRETSQEIRPAQHVPPPTPLRAGENGRFTEHPPALLRPPQTGQPGTQPGRPGGPPATTERQPPGPPRAEDRDRAQPGAEREERGRPGGPGTARDQQGRPGDTEREGRRQGPDVGRGEDRGQTDRGQPRAPQGRTQQDRTRQDRPDQSRDNTREERQGTRPDRERRDTRPDRQERPGAGRDRDERRGNAPGREEREGVVPDRARRDTRPDRQEHPDAGRDRDDRRGSAPGRQEREGAAPERDQRGPRPGDQHEAPSGRTEHGPASGAQPHGPDADRGPGSDAHRERERTGTARTPEERRRQPAEPPDRAGPGDRGGEVRPKAPGGPAGNPRPEREGAIGPREDHGPRPAARPEHGPAREMGPARGGAPGQAEEPRR